MSQSNISPANRDHVAAVAALKANTEAGAALKAQRAKLLEEDATARAELNNGKVTPAILEAISTNIAKAAGLLPAIESLEADRPALARAVDQATGERWAEQVRAHAPQGTGAALLAIREELATKIKAEVEDARAKAEAVAAESGALLAEAAQLHRIGALPRGATYNPSTGLYLDGVLIGSAFTDDLAAKVGRELDAEASKQRRAAAWERRDAA